MKKTIPFLIVVVLTTPLAAWEVLDRVIAVVNSYAILESELNSKLNQMSKFQPIAPNKMASEKSKLLDRLIEDALVLESATNEAIVVPDSRVLSHLERLLEQYLLSKIKNPKEVEKMVPGLIRRLEARLKNPASLTDDKQLDTHIAGFINYIETSQKINFVDFFEDLRSQMRREQLMSIAIGVTPPTRKDALAWYNANKKKLGFEIWVKQILIRPAADSITAERAVNERLTEIRNRVLAGESFEQLAMKYSQDQATAAKGGDLGWAPIADMDPYFAGYINTLTAPGQISQVFKSGQGYHIVKYLGRRDVTFEKVENMIMYKLYVENLTEQFKKWVNKRKQDSEIQIFLENYVKS